MCTLNDTGGQIENLLGSKLPAKVLILRGNVTVNNYTLNLSFKLVGRKEREKKKKNMVLCFSSKLLVKRNILNE